MNAVPFLLRGRRADCKFAFRSAFASIDFEEDLLPATPSRWGTMTWLRNWRSWLSRGRTKRRIGEEKRQSVRYDINLETSCRLLAMVQGEPHPVRVRNISAGGISLVLAREVPADELLEIELLNRPRMFLCKLQVRITYRVEHPSGDWIIGGAFMRKLEEDELKSLLA
jgi:PilZ domain